MNRKIIPSLLITLLLLLAACQAGDPAPAVEEASETVTEAEPAEADAAAEVEPPAEVTEAEEVPDSDPEQAPEVAEGSIQGRLAVVNAEGRLATVNPNGSDERILSGEDAFAQFPAWSPNGNQIAVIEATGGGFGINVYDDSAEAVPETVYDNSSLPPIYLYWFPDGEQVSFIARDPAGLALHLAPADASAPSRVLSSGQPFYWQWLNNNKQALIHVGTQSIAFLDLEGNEVPTGLGRGGIFQTPAMSADTRFFAYQEQTEEGRKIQVKDLSADELVFQADHQGVLTMGWAPEKRLLAFLDTAPDQFLGELVVVDLETAEATTVVSQNVVAFFWSPDGRYIAFLTPETQGPQAQDGTLQTVALTQQQQRPTITLGIVDTQEDTTQFIYQFEATGYFVQQFVPFFDQYALSHRVWSPDSQALAFPTLDEEGAPVIQVFPIDGSGPRTVTNGVSAFWSHE